MVALDKDKAGIDPDNIWRLASRLKRLVYSNYYIFRLVCTSIDVVNKRNAK